MELKTGETFGRYRIETLLGTGGMGAVYRAHDTQLERLVAIKVLTTPADLLREARSASALNHPNVCTIYEVGEERASAFIAMEYIEGRTLDSIVSKAPLPLPSAVDYGFQITDALSHAHERGVIHGDLKTANILVSPRKQIKIVDFGLARRRQESFPGASSVTTAAVIAGTPYAMAPEQLSGAEADMQTDVWALGVVFFEMLTGAPPFTGATTPELTSAILRDLPAPLPETVPASLRRIVDRCLSKDTTQRFRNAGEVRGAFELIRSSRGTPLYPKDPAEDTQWPVPLPLALAETGPASVQLVGRDADLSVLNAALERARAGRRQFVFVTGEAGIGKTRLISEFARGAAAMDVAVLLGRCDAEALIPYQPFVEALDWYIRACPPAVLERQLDTVESASELAELIPGISHLFTSAKSALESNPEGRRYRLFEAVASLLANSSRRRALLVILEDVHWADRPTLLMLRHVLRSSHEGSLLLLATYRETELDRTHPLADILADLRREPAAARLKLGGLGQHDVAQFLERWVGTTAAPLLVKLVAESTEGNPFFMSEVLRHLSETGKLDRLQSGARVQAADIGLPEGVREVIGRRISRLSEDCKRVLATASVVGRDFAFPLLHAVADVSEDRLLDVIDEAQSARVIQDAPGISEGYTFTHALIRETLYGELTAARRIRLHRKVAEALEARMKPGNEPLADLAFHYGQAAASGDVEKAIMFAIRAGEAAAAVFALEEAARFYGMALQALSHVPDDAQSRARRLELHAKSGKAYTSVGQWAAAKAQLEAAVALVPSEQLARRAELLNEMAVAAFWALDVPKLRMAAGEALAIADAIGRDDLWADAMSSIAAADNADGEVLKAIERDRLAIQRVGGIRTMALGRAAISLYHAGFNEEALLRSKESVDAALKAGDPAFIVYSLSHLGISNTASGNYAAAQRAFQDAREYGRRYGALSVLGRAIAMSTGVYTTLGDLGNAESCALEARDLARQVSFVPAFISAGVDLLFIYMRSGELGRAERLFDEVARSCADAKGWHAWLWDIRLWQARAELAFVRKDWQDVIAKTNEGILKSGTLHRLKYEVLGLITRSRARLKLGERSEAIKDASAAAALARRLGDPAVLLEALAAWLEVDGNDALLAEARGSIDRIVGNVPDEPLRRRFLDSPTVQSVLHIR